MSVEAVAKGDSGGKLGFRILKIKGTGGLGKAAVMGLLERHGPDGHSLVRVKTIANVGRETLLPEVRDHVETGSEVFTDAWRSYTGLAANYIHKVIDHAEGTF